MRNVATQLENPFGFRPPCPSRCTDDSDRRAVFGYGNANADFHVIGDHPRIHGGVETARPFVGSPNGETLLEALQQADMISRDSSVEFNPRNCFFSYRYLCCLDDSQQPTPAQYREFDQFFDAELRAIGAHVLLPVGESVTRHVLEEYTSIAHRVEIDMDNLHATELRGHGFLIMPIADPSEWTDHDKRLADALDDLRSRDYRQTVDLGRFIPGGEPYYVR